LGSQSVLFGKHKRVHTKTAESHLPESTWNISNPCIALQAELDRKDRTAVLCIYPLLCWLLVLAY